MNTTDNPLAHSLARLGFISRPVGFTENEPKLAESRHCICNPIYPNSHEDEEE